MANPKDLFREGIAYFRSGNVHEALGLFSKSIELGLSDPAVYDSRAAVYEKLGQLKDALRDAKRCIDIEPTRWQGYARSARLFMKLGRHSSASHMVDLAIERVSKTDRKRLDDLETMRGKISQAVKEGQLRLSQTFYHFGNLPVEIAVNIFKMLVDEDHTRAVILAQVCKEWRVAILGTPSLWTTLVLSSAHPAKKAKLWKQRSKGKFLSLSLPQHSSTALEELGGMSFSSLKALKLEGWTYSQLASILPGFDVNTLSCLEVFEATNCQLWQERIPNMRLRTLSLAQSKFDFSLTADDLTELQEFSYRGRLLESHCDHFLWLLHRNPGLRRLTIDFEDKPPLEEDAGQRRELPNLVYLPHLTHLDFLTFSPNSRSILPRLRLPQLRTFCLTKAYPPANGVLDVLLLSECGKRLTELRLRQCSIAAQDIISVLREASALESLECSHAGGNQANHILEALADCGSSAETAQHNTFLCPRLREINFSDCPDVRGGPLVRLTKLRLPPENAASSNDSASVPVAALDTIIVDGCPAVDASILPWLRSKVKVVSCVYATKKAARWKR